MRSRDANLQCVAMMPVVRYEALEGRMVSATQVAQPLSDEVKALNKAGFAVGDQAALGLTLGLFSLLGRGEYWFCLYLSTGGSAVKV